MAIQPDAWRTPPDPFPPDLAARAALDRLAAARPTVGPAPSLEVAIAAADDALPPARPDDAALERAYRAGEHDGRVAMALTYQPTTLGGQLDRILDVDAAGRALNERRIRLLLQGVVV